MTIPSTLTEFRSEKYLFNLCNEIEQNMWTEPGTKEEKNAKKERHWMQERGRNRKRESVRLVCNIKRARKIAKKQIAHIIYKTEGNIVERAIEKGAEKLTNFFLTTFFCYNQYDVLFFSAFCVLHIDGIERKVKIKSMEQLTRLIY